MVDGGLTSNLFVMETLPEEMIPPRRKQLSRRQDRNAMVYRNTGRARRLAETAPGLHTDALSWQLFALCRGEDLSLFFHPDGERGAARRHRQELAKRLCEQCGDQPMS